MKICPKCETPAPDDLQKCCCGYDFSALNKNRIPIAILCLHIAALLYVLIGAYLFFLHTPTNDSKIVDGIIFIFIINLIVLLVIAALNEVVARAIKKRKFWGWIFGIILFGLYIPSPFLPLGVFGLWALLTPNSRKAFGGGIKSSDKLAKEETSKKT